MACIGCLALSIHGVLAVPVHSWHQNVDDGSVLDSIGDWQIRLSVHPRWTLQPRSMVSAVTKSATCSTWIILRARE